MVAADNFSFCLKNVVKTYNNGELVCPVNNVSLCGNAGDFITVEGPSGIGKSTLLYLLGGLLKADSGEIYVDNDNLCSLSDKDLTKLRSQKIGYIFQETNLFQSLTAYENLTFALKVANKYKSVKLSKDEIKTKVEWYLDKIGMSERKNFLPHQLSVGQKRRLVIARALITEPRLVLADEPTNDLDEHWAGVVVDMLKEVAENNGIVLMVTHNSQWAMEANRRYEMNKGNLEPKQTAN